MGHTALDVPHISNATLSWFETSLPVWVTAAAQIATAEKAAIAAGAKESEILDAAYPGLKQIAVTLETCPLLHSNITSTLDRVGIVQRLQAALASHALNGSLLNGLINAIKQGGGLVGIATNILSIIKLFQGLNAGASSNQ
jgi:hypothetical protein